MKRTRSIGQDLRLAPLVIAALACAACGGGGSPASGGGSGGGTATAPQFTSAATASVTENTTGTFYTAAAQDPQNDPVTFTLYSGADAGQFVLDGTGLRFNAAPNYDLPTDANGDNVYEVVLRASAGGEATDLALKVRVTNDREGVIVTRVATGLVDPVGMAFQPVTSKLLIAERGGRVVAFDPESGSKIEDIFIRDHRKPGELLGISWGFRDQVFQEGVYLVAHDPAEGLFVEAFNADRGFTGYARLGSPWTAPTTVSMLGSQSMYIAVGDSSGNLAQDASSAYGKLFELPTVDPYAGASVPSPIVIRPAIIGDGIQKPGGISPAYGNLYLADQGSSVAHEITAFNPKARPLDFGWPFYEGAKSIRTNPPAAVNGPSIVYPVGTGRKEGTGVIAGIINDYNSFPALGSVYVFADTNGTIWTIQDAKITDGILHGANEIEDRTEDFAPDAGKIDAPVAIIQGGRGDRFFILDVDGEIFMVTGN
jgi:hypothetical protein